MNLHCRRHGDQTSSVRRAPHHYLAFRLAKRGYAGTSHHDYGSRRYLDLASHLDHKIYYPPLSDVHTKYPEVHCMVALVPCRADR
ncbi:protein of unknown function [Paraburkholderia dioscoreae]|uniref:Uncharacterized protein n=1 Tax=Paraburkholderia dioscoreae TaxID=2604047 RepID=A0A5Q4Z3V3_9BURK|nr:protein of unknown function [Paraburkholderia dioscoreae]